MRSNTIGADVTTLNAMALLALTFVRTSELIAARWEVFDFEEALSTIPAERRKGRRGNRREHLVPLSRQAAAILQALQRPLQALRHAAIRHQHRGKGGASPRRQAAGHRQTQRQRAQWQQLQLNGVQPFVALQLQPALHRPEPRRRRQQPATTRQQRLQEHIAAEASHAGGEAMGATTEPQPSCRRRFGTRAKSAARAR
jgi:hypothetical protein